MGKVAASVSRSFNAICLIQMILAFIWLTTDPFLESKQAEPPAWKAALPGPVESFPNNPRLDPRRKRRCLAFTATPPEISRLRSILTELSSYKPYRDVFETVHISIPYKSKRLSNLTYPSLLELQALFPDDWVVLHRLEDNGPLTRYIGPLAYERHPDTSIVVLDVDSQSMDWQVRGFALGRSAPPVRNLPQLALYSQQIDINSQWCLQGENFSIDRAGNVLTKWDTFPEVDHGDLKWNLVHFCRGAGGLLFKPSHFSHFHYNQTAYHESCLSDDDRWVGFEMERVGVQRKVLKLPPRTFPGTRPYLRRRLGSLSGLFALNLKLQSDQTCTRAWMKYHPETFPTASA